MAKKERRASEYYVMELVDAAEELYRVHGSADNTVDGVKRMRDCEPGCYRVANFTTGIMEVLRQTVPKISVVAVAEHRPAPEAADASAPEA